ncbi:hypothetical protein AAMO2058_000256500 [Amorphochlora amoebiformis]
MTSTHPKSPLSPALRERFGPSRKVRGSFSSSRCSFATSGEINFNSPGRRTPWVLYIDDSTHTAYYYNMMTGETSWRRPRHYVIHDSTLQFSPQSSVDQSPSTHLRSSSGIVFASPAEEKKIAAVVDRSGILQPVTPSNLKFPRLNSPHLHQESIKSPKFDHESNADFMFEGITLKEEMRVHNPSYGSMLQ